MRGARGNSGVIFALIFKGFAQCVDGLDYIDAKSLAKGLECGCDEAYAALEKPSEGTMLTVIRVAASKAISASEKGHSSLSVFSSALSGAKKALKSTPNLLPVLKKHNVVDAGGQGLVYIMEGMLSAKPTFIKGNNTLPPESVVSAEKPEFIYCTEFLINGNDDFDLSKLRRFLSDIGDCSVAVKGKGFVKVHVHTNSPDLAIGKGLEYGELSSIKIDNMRIQSQNQNEVCEAIEICGGKGLKRFFESFDGVRALECNKALNVSSGDILSCINSCNRNDVVILTNCKNNILAANQAASMSNKSVIVIPSENAVEGIAAAKVFSPLISAEENASLMKKAISETVSGYVTYASKQGDYDGMNFSQGQIIGLSGNKIICCDDDISVSAVTVAERLVKLSKRNKVTFFYGNGISVSNARKTAELAKETIGNISVEVIEGGQPVYYYLISVE